MEKAVQIPPNAMENDIARLAPLLLACFLGLSRVWVGGYSFGTADNAWQVPAVRALADGEFAADYVFSNPPSLSLFFPAAAALARVLDIGALYFAGYVAASLATALLLYRLAGKILGSAPAAILAVVLLMTKKDLVAGATTWDALFLPRTAAMPFMLLSWLMLIEGKFVRAGASLGAAAALHPLTGVYSGVISLIYLFSTNRRWMRGAGLLALAAAPFGAITVLAARGASPPFFTGEASWQRAMLVRNIHHLSSNRFPLMAALLLYAMWVARRLAGRGRPQALLQAAAAAAALAFMYAAGALAAGRLAGLSHPALALLKPPAAALLQPLRVCGPLGILLLLATAGVLAQALRKGPLAAGVAACAAVAIFHEHWVVSALLIAAAVIAAGDLRARTAGAAALALAAAAAAAVFHPVLLVLLVLTAALSVLLGASARRIAARPSSGALAAVVLVAGALPASWAPAAAGKLFALKTEGNDRYERSVELEITGPAPFEEAARWAAANTAPDEVIIIPPWWEGFRVASGRPVFGTWKDGTLVFFRRELARQWLARMALLGAPLRGGTGSRYPPSGKAAYRALSGADFLRAAGRFPARYVVTDRGSIDDLTEVYAGEHVKVYELPGPEVRP